LRENGLTHSLKEQQLQLTEGKEGPPNSEFVNPSKGSGPRNDETNQCEKNSSQQKDWNEFQKKGGKGRHAGVRVCMHDALKGRLQAPF